MKNLAESNFLPSLQIGFAPFFHSDSCIEKRLDSDTLFSIKEVSADWEKDICLFRLPEHLRRKWWEIAAKELLQKSDAKPNFDGFINSFKAFASFKGIPILPSYDFVILVRSPGELFKMAPALKKKNLCALVNLGDEETKILVENEQITLETGDGCWIPIDHTIQLTATSNKTDLDVLLQIYC